MNTAEHATMNAGATRPIVVGVDGSWASVVALGWALAEAARASSDVEVVTAWPHTGPVFVHEVPGHHSDARERARKAQARAVRAARSDADEAVATTTVLENARPDDVLVERARGARMLVLGSAEAGTHAALVDRCRERVDCPIAVVAADTGEVRVLEPLARTRG